MTTIRRHALMTIFALSLCGAHAFGQSKTVSDGEVRVTTDGESQAWDSGNSEWVRLETFWDRYVARRGGLTWGRRSVFPPYEDVDELDTIIIELESGPCLMEFFHTRWRRANDVRRWAPAFNEYGGCPRVFD